MDGLTLAFGVNPGRLTARVKLASEEVGRAHCWRNDEDVDWTDWQDVAKNRGSGEARSRWSGHVDQLGPQIEATLARHMEPLLAALWASSLVMLIASTKKAFQRAVIDSALAEDALISRFEHEHVVAKELTRG